MSTKIKCLQKLDPEFELNLQKKKYQKMVNFHKEFTKVIAECKICHKARTNLSLRISPYSVRMRENTDLKNSKSGFHPVL